MLMLMLIMLLIMLMLSNNLINFYKIFFYAYIIKWLEELVTEIQCQNVEV
jgi:hypothetical protein